MLMPYMLSTEHIGHYYWDNSESPLHAYLYLCRAPTLIMYLCLPRSPLHAYAPYTANLVSHEKHYYTPTQSLSTLGLVPE